MPPSPPASVASCSFRFDCYCYVTCTASFVREKEEEGSKGRHHCNHADMLARMSEEMTDPPLGWKMESIVL
eukprot:2868235-Pyramimonas_sp.AAC.1